MATTAPPLPAETLWSQPPALERFWRGAQKLLGTGWIVIGVIAMLVVFKDWGFLGFGAGVLGFFLVYYACVAIHELGHALSARLAGMSLQGVQIGWIFISARRRNWRVRWQRPVLAHHGYAWAFHDPARSMRPQMFWMSVGGPIANVVAALALWPVALVAPEPWLGAVLVAIGTNVMLALASSLPTSVPSDGMMAWRWWRGIPEDHPELRIARLMALSNAGVRCDQLPSDLVAGLEQGTVFERVNALWIAVKSRQNRGEWAAVVAQADAVADFHAGLEAPYAKAFVPYRVLAEVEIAFSQALLSGDATRLRALPDNLDGCPWVLSRTQALLAKLEGRHADMERLLAQARMQLDELSDRAWLESEDHMADVVRSASA